jgi:uncharacterized protein
MIELWSFVLVVVAAASASALTLYSGFGLGTLLLPLFALFFPIDVAVAATAVVHGANSLFKVTLVGRRADRRVVLSFGMPAIIAASVGATALSYVSDFGELVTYSVGPRTAVITPIKLVMGALILAFALIELLPRFRELEFDPKFLPLGGVLSGFFGGFSGHQGALRAAFLVKTGLSTEAFVGSSAVIGLLVDLTRIGFYAILLLGSGDSNPIGAGQWALIASGVLAAFAGVLIGTHFLHRITMRTVQNITGILLLTVAVALGAGVI